MERWTRLVLRHRWFVLAAWVAVFVTAGLASTKLSDLLTNRFTLPGTDAQKAEQILQDHFGQRSTGSFTLVVATDAGAAESFVPRVEAAAGRAVAKLPTGRLVSVQPLGDSVVAAQIVSELEPADAKGHTSEMRAAVGAIPGATTYLTGQAATEHDLDPVFSEDLKKGELFIAIPIALVILVFTFGTLSFLLPFAFSLVTIPTTLGIIWIFVNFIELTTDLVGLEKTGRLVTAAGLIMFAALMGFVAGSIVGLQQFGFGLAAAILIDVTLVRSLLVPSAMKLFGHCNWWLPERVAKVLRVRPSPLEEHRPALSTAAR